MADHSSKTKNGRRKPHGRPLCHRFLHDRSVVLLRARHLHLGTRRVHIGGITRYPHQGWMAQITRNGTDAEDGFLVENGCRYLIHDRDSKFCEHFDGLLRSVNIEPVKLPPRSPNLNPYTECFVLCLDRLILFGEKSLTYVLNEYITHYHLEHNHQGIGNTLISPRPDSDKDRERDNTLSHKDLSPLSRSSIVSIPSGRIFWPDGTYNSFSAS